VNDVNILLMLGLVVGAPVDTGTVIDKGTFKVYQRDRALGTETFEYDSRGDSLTIFSHIDQVLPGPGGDVALDKQVVLIVGSLDFELRFYQSKMKVGGKDLLRALVVNDTAFTAYRESGKVGGAGDRFDKPPGRVFVLDGQVFMLFDIMCRDLGRTSFTERPVSVVLLRDEQDQVTEIKAIDMGADTIRWAARPVVAHKLRFADSYSTFNAWVGPRGNMLKLEQDGSGLRVEREPSPAVKRQEQATPR
jgi:hypothetical protein